MLRVCQVNTIHQVLNADDSRGPCPRCSHLLADHAVPEVESPAVLALCIGSLRRSLKGQHGRRLGAPKGMLLPSWAILPAAYHEGTLRRPALLRSCAAHHQVERMSTQVRDRAPQERHSFTLSEQLRRHTRRVTWRMLDCTGLVSPDGLSPV